MIKEILKKAILKIIMLIEKYEYQDLKLDQNNASKKILNTLELSGIEIETDSGWQKASHIHITQPYDIWKIKTESGKYLECADNHRVFTDTYHEVFVKDLKPGSFIQTVNGPEKVTVVNKENTVVAMFDITVDHSDHRYYTNGILSHNTVTSSIFIAWYLSFHFDRNVMIVANKMATTTEIVDKVKVIIKNLPFFIKPGVTTSGATGMKFDNGCRLYSQATTKTAAIGFTIHLLYADEFAHIHANFLQQFYRSIYPTLSSSKISRIIISSTPNGMNMFYELYTAALEGKNSYKAIRVDWWQVPGRDEQWKKQEIANLGSEELFNQEYGNQFLASSRLLLPGTVLEYINRISKKYIYKDHEAFYNDPELYKDMMWHPDYDPASISKGSKHVIAVDIGDGVARDYSVLNVFKMEPQSKAMIRKLKDWRDETGFFRLRQVGMFRSNVVSVEDLARVLETLMFEVYNPEDIKTVMEINFKGNLIYERVGRNREFFPETFLHTKHSISAPVLKPGVKMQKDNKEIFCRELRNLIINKKVLITEERTVIELASFGINSAGSYSSQIGNDDVAMSCVNLVSMFDSVDFYDMVEDIYDGIDNTYRKSIDAAIEKGGGSEEITEGFQLLKDLDSDFALSLQDMQQQIAEQQKIQWTRGNNKGFGKIG